MDSASFPPACNQGTCHERGVGCRRVTARLDLYAKKDDCLHYLEEMALNTCGGNDPSHNPYKCQACGTLKVDGIITYCFDPRSLRETIIDDNIKIGRVDYLEFMQRYY
jgi:hypothetical protein